MDKETAVELEKLKAKVESIESWKKSVTATITKAVMKTVTWLLFTGGAGLAYGLHIPENFRKRLIEWLSQ